MTWNPLNLILLLKYFLVILLATTIANPIEESDGRNFLSNETNNQDKVQLENLSPVVQADVSKNNLNTNDNSRGETPTRSSRITDVPPELSSEKSRIDNKTPNSPGAEDSKFAKLNTLKIKQFRVNTTKTKMEPKNEKSSDVTTTTAFPTVVGAKMKSNPEDVQSVTSEPDNSKLNKINQDPVAPPNGKALSSNTTTQEKTDKKLVQNLEGTKQENNKKTEGNHEIGDIGKSGQDKEGSISNGSSNMAGINSDINIQKDGHSQIENSETETTTGSGQLVSKMKVQVNVPDGDPNKKKSVDGTNSNVKKMEQQSNYKEEINNEKKSLPSTNKHQAKAKITPEVENKISETNVITGSESLTKFRSNESAMISEKEASVKQNQPKVNQPVETVKNIGGSKIVDSSSTSTTSPLANLDNFDLQSDKPSDTADGLLEDGNNNSDYPHSDDEKQSSDTSPGIISEDDKNIDDKSSKILPKQPNLKSDDFADEKDNHFFAYFVTGIVVFAVGYLVVHNKQKILGLIVEGRTGRARRRSHTYKRLENEGAKFSQIF